MLIPGVKVLPDFCSLSRFPKTWSFMPKGGNVKVPCRSGTQIESALLIGILRVPLTRHDRGLCHRPLSAFGADKSL